MSNSRYFKNTTKTNKDGRKVYKGKRLKKFLYQTMTSIS